MIFTQPTYHRYKVEWEGKVLDFVQVSGLSFTVLFDRSSDISSEKVPDFKNFEPISIKRPIENTDNDFFNWINRQKPSRTEKRDLLISLIDEDQRPITKWKVKDCFPVQYLIVPLEENPVPTEVLVLHHGGWQIEKPSVHEDSETKELPSLTMKK